MTSGADGRLGGARFLALGLVTAAAWSAGIDSGAFAQGASLSLHVIETEVDGEVDFDESRPIRVDLTVDSAEQFLSTLGLVDSRAVDSQTVQLLLREGSGLGGEPLERHLQATWVVDFDEIPAMTPTSEPGPGQLPTKSGDQLVRAIRSKTESLLPDRTYRHSLLIASQAVRAGGGDCTEHAVVAAAVARSLGVPARVIVGWALLQVVVDTDPIATSTMGHAWAEVWIDQQWRVVDTALQPVEPDPELIELGAELRIRYLPQTEWSNEGPGYSGWLLQRISTRPSKVVLRPADRDTAPENTTISDNH